MPRFLSGLAIKILTSSMGNTHLSSDRRLEKLYNEELHNLYSSPSIIKMIKLRRMRWAEHVARMGEKCI
jgi:hypothetical protein